MTLALSKPGCLGPRALAGHPPAGSVAAAYAGILGEFT
jgi:hypothetical protein